jgi:hypothetical protein
MPIIRTLEKNLVWFMPHWMRSSDCIHASSASAVHAEIRYDYRETEERQQQAPAHGKHT